MVEGSRLERGAAVCFLWVRDGSNKLSSRLENAEQIPRVALLVRDGDARRIASLRLEVRSRRRLSAVERASDRKLARVNRRERNRLTPVEFSGGTVLEIWYGLRRRLSDAERA